MPRYIKKDSELGYVEDSAEIEYLKFNNMRHAVLGCMLGDFDDQGRYVVNELIAKELIDMRKYIVETLDNVSICLSELKLDKQISFAVTFEADKATLSLIEKLNYEGNYRINSGAYSNINEYVLDQVETSGVIDKTIIYRRWNIRESGGSVLDVFNMDEETIAQFAGIVNRFKYLIKANQTLLEKEESIEAIETDYLIGMLDLVARFPKLKAAVDSKIRQELRDKKSIICIDKPNFVKTLNELVTQSIEANISLLTEEERLEFETEKHIIHNSYNIKMDAVVDARTDVEHSNGERYTKISINTHGAEALGSVGELATLFVQVKQQREAAARASAVKSHGKSILQYKPNSDHGSYLDLMGAYLSARLGIDIRDNLFKPVEHVAQEETTTKSTTKEAPAAAKKKAEPAAKKPASKKKATTSAKPAKKKAEKKDNKSKLTDQGPKKHFVYAAWERKKAQEEDLNEEVNATLDSNRGVVNKQERIIQKNTGRVEIDVDEDNTIKQRRGENGVNTNLNSENTIEQSKDGEIKVTSHNVTINEDEKIVMHNEADSKNDKEDQFEHDEESEAAQLM